MNESPVGGVVRGAPRDARGRAFAFGPVNWLGLAATPTFAVMALLSGVGGTPDILCSATQPASPLNEMAVMYLLMSAFHAPPWLKLISDWRNGARRPCRW